MGIESEIERLAQQYEKRDSSMYTGDWRKDAYHPRNPMGRLFHEHHFNLAVDALNAVGVGLDGADALDFGCGSGGWLRMLIELGADPARLTGIDLSERRLASARRLNPAINFVKNDGGGIPFPDRIFDLVMQVVVFSSILDEGLAAALACEMARVTRPGGHILWVDHDRALGDTLSGYPQSKVEEFFAGCRTVYADRAHPRYFRRWQGRPWLCRLLYHFSRVKCDSLILVMRKEG